MNRQYDNRGRDQFNIENAHNVIVQNREPSTRPRYERLLLQQVKGEVAARLEQSLHNKVLIILDKQAQPEQVKRLWDAEVKIGSKLAEPLLPQTSILEVFEQSEIVGQLLILGAPGAGKTTTMLDLAQSLIDKAIQDSSYPIPALFNLSSWKNPRQSIPTWLVEELNLKYGVRKDIGKKLIEEKQLLPMLDGLDEVKPEHQEPCVEFINQWLGGDDRPLFIVVCSRREEYANYQTRLHLNGAIVLQELTDDRIREYLSEVKRFELWPLLQQDKVLLELVKTPLLLSITVLSYEKLSLQEWQQLTSTKQRIKMLLGAYVQRMLHREMESRAYRKLALPEAIQTQHWLILLARQLQRESQTEFLIEKMQPSWLVTNKQKKAYRWAASLIFGLIVTTLIAGLMIGLIGGLIGGLSSKEVNIKKIPNQGIWKSVNNALFITLISWLTFGLISGLFFGLSSGLTNSAIGIISGLFFGLFFGLFSAAGKAAIQHLALRLTLHQSGSIPWNYARFLNYCTERGFLQRVGGRYRFIHKQLQDYFAEM